MQVSLRHILISLFQVHILYPSYKENAFPLAQMHWFDYKSLVVLFLIKLLAKIVHLLREDPCLGEEIVLSGENFGHPH